MLPLIRFKELLENTKKRMNEDMEELITGATLLAARPNYLTVDEMGYYHVQASGPIEEIIPALIKQVERLQRIKQQKERN